MPGMLFRQGRPWVVVGSMGGDAQPQIHAQVVSALVDGGVDVGSAIAMPRWFAEPERHLAPARIVRAEPRFGRASCGAWGAWAMRSRRPGASTACWATAMASPCSTAGRPRAARCWRRPTPERGTSGDLVTPDSAR